MAKLNWKYDKDENESIAEIGEYNLQLKVSESLDEDGVFLGKMFYKNTTIRFLINSEWVRRGQGKQKFNSLDEGKLAVEETLKKVNSLNDLRKLVGVKY